MIPLRTSLYEATRKVSKRVQNHNAFSTWYVVGRTVFSIQVSVWRDITSR